MKIQITQKIFSEAPPHSFGQIGLVLKDLSGNLLIATSRELLAHCQKILIEESGKLVTIGSRPVAYYHTEGCHKAAVKLLGWFTPNPTTTIKPQSLSDYPLSNEDDIFMKDVFILGTENHTDTGFVSKINCYAEFSMPNETEPRLIEGLFKISTKIKGQDFASIGSTGALVVSHDNELIGFIVGILDGNAFVAPLKELCLRECLSIATDGEIRDHNRAANAIENSQDQKIPRPLQKIQEVVIAAGFKSNSIQHIFKDWLDIGWDQIKSGQASDAFSPYSEYFKECDPTKPNSITLGIHQLIAKEFKKSTTKNPEITDHFVDAYLDFIDSFNGDDQQYPNHVSDKQPPSEIERKSSHHHVIGDGEDSHVV